MSIHTITVSFKLSSGTLDHKPVSITIEPRAFDKIDKKHIDGSPTKIITSYTGTNGTLYHLEHSTKDAWELRNYLDVLYRWSPVDISIEHQGIRIRHHLKDVLERIQLNRKIMNAINAGEPCVECGDAEGECDCSENEEDTRMCYKDYMDEIKGQVFALTGRSAFRNECKRLYAAPLLQDKECPILLEPLESGSTSQMPCGHLLSTKALYKLDSKVNSAGNSQVECPLCRGKANWADCLDI
jgi:hypothetical protein